MYRKHSYNWEKILISTPGRMLLTFDPSSEYNHNVTQDFRIMPLLLTSCGPNDTPSIVSLSAAAFSAPTNANIFPNTPAVNAFRAKRANHSFQHDPFLVFHKIIDTDLPPEEQLVAYAKWAKPHTKEELAKSGYVDLIMGEELPKDCNRELILKTEEMKNEVVEDVMGDRPFYCMCRPVIVRGHFPAYPNYVPLFVSTISLFVSLLDLHALATHPAHSGRGCAGMLIKWGMQRAEEEGVECYVEAQDTSLPIFNKYGWKHVREIVKGDERWATVLVYTPEMKAER